MVTSKPLEFAEVSVGKFCRLLGPLLEPQKLLLRVTPFSSRSIPSPMLEKMELERIELLTEQLTPHLTDTPAKPL